MALEILHYFAPISGYAYLGIAELGAIARRHGCSVRHAPVDIQAVFAASAVTPPVAQSAARKAYRRADMRRWATRRNLPLNEQPKFWPAPGALASRYIIAADTLEKRGGDMAEAVLAAVWANDLDIADEDVLLTLARERHFDPVALKASAADTSTQARAEAFTRSAIAQGLFGSPTYIIGTEVFFGQDRLDFLEEEIVRRKSGTGLA